MGKILLVTAHPDDESFGPGGTIAKYAAEGVEVQLLCATRGESGQWSDVKSQGQKLEEVREKEHRKASKILGIGSHEYMGYIDGYLSNILMDEMMEKIRRKIDAFKPDLLITFDITGISGHLDHIAVSLATTKVFEEEESVKKLYYFTVSKEIASDFKKKFNRRVFGRKNSEITTRIDVSKYLPTKIKAALCHQTQKRDIERLRTRWERYGNTELFVLAEARMKTKLPEVDLFAGIDKRQAML